MKRIVLIVLSCCLSMMLFGCKEKKIDATAVCGQIDIFESNLGLINVPQLTLGHYFWVDPANKTASGMGVMSFQDSSIIPTNPTDSLSIDYNSDLTINFGADLPETVKVNLSSQIKKSTELTAKHLQRKSLNNAIKLLNDDADSKEAIKEHLIRNTNNKVFVVHSVANADNLNIGLANSHQSGADVSVVNYGEFSLEVKYQCSNTLNAIGKDAPAFFKATPVAYDAEEDKLYVDTSESLSPAKVSFVHVVHKN